MRMSVGSALAQGKPVVFVDTESGKDGKRKIEVVCEKGKEKDALETLAAMKIITLVRPVRK
jgi:hypothetical protein